MGARAHAYGMTVPPIPWLERAIKEQGKILPDPDAESFALLLDWEARD